MTTVLPRSRMSRGTASGGGRYRALWARSGLMPYTSAATAVPQSVSCGNPSRHSFIPRIVTHNTCAGQTGDLRRRSESYGREG